MTLKQTILAAALSFLCCIALLPTPSMAHHGITGQFDLDQSVTVTGVVNRVRFVNPHAYVYFKVKNDAGEEEQWRCELRSGSLLKRAGWTEEMFALGKKITVNGSPDRRDPKTCFAQSIKFEDGSMVRRRDTLNQAGQVIKGERELKREDGTPNLEGNWVEVRGARRGGQSRPPRYVTTQSARDKAFSFSEDENPRMMCEPTNIILDYSFDQMVNKIEQTETKIVITYGFMDVVRTLHLDGKFPDTIERSVAGYSVAKWKGDTLVVTTKGFATGFLQAPGGGSRGAIPHSDQMEITERFSVNSSGNELTREYTVVDPVYLDQSHSHSNKSELTGNPFIPYNCDDLTLDKLRSDQAEE